MLTTKRFFALLITCLIVAAAYTPAGSQDIPERVSADKPRLQDPGDKPARPYTEEELEIAGKIFNMLDGEQQMLLNGLRYLMRPAYEQKMMAGLLYQPCPLPIWGSESEHPYGQLESLRLWAMLAARMPMDDDMDRELQRFIATEHKRYDDSLAAYAVPMAACTAALRYPEIKYERELRDKAEDLMYIAMKVRDLTAVESPCIVNSYIWPMWYGNHVWRAVMANCCCELDLKYNEHVWESELKNVSQATQKELGWISTHGGNRDDENDLDCNLMALAAISMGLASPKKDGLPKSARSSLEKRLRYVPDVLKRLETEYSGEELTGARLALIRTFDPEFAPAGREADMWRTLVRQSAVNEMLASGAVRTTTGISHELGLDGRMRRRRARMPAETAMTCLSVCGGFYSREPSPIAGLSADDVAKALHALSVLHASVLPPMPIGGALSPEVEVAIADGCDWLVKMQLADGSFGEKIVETVYPAYTAVALHALMHGDYAPDSAPVKAGMDWLREKVPTAIDNKGRGGRTYMSTYDAGIILMMYARYYEKLLVEERVLESIGMGDANEKRERVWNKIANKDQYVINKLVEFLEGAHAGSRPGGWGYAPPPQGHKSSYSDNSCSQFGGCGYKCAALLGAKVDIDIFRMEAERLISQYSSAPGEKQVEFKLFDQLFPSDDERYAEGGIYERRAWEGSIAPGGWGYSPAVEGGTQMQYVATGMAILAASRDELWAHNKLSLKMHRKIDLHIFGAQAWLAKQDYWQFDYEENDDYEDAKLAGKNPPGGIGWGSIYNLYALERGCVMSGYDLLMGEVNWYEHVARWLLDNQGTDGMWGNGIIDTAWAILILRRAAPPGITVPNPPQPPPGKAPDPITDRERNPRSPITPGRVKPEKKEEEPKPDKPKPAGPVTPGKEEKETEED